MRKPILASIAVLGLIAAPAMAAATTHKAKPVAHKTVKKAEKTAPKAK